ncbi:MFS transporter [Sporobolomyces koalae]|uniref:MFS transporter n=1 Tax=Sporobolomyces koalae TaxID=500713 RepID=UPI003171426C
MVTEPIASEEPPDAARLAASPNIRDSSRELGHADSTSTPPTLYQPRNSHEANDEANPTERVRKSATQVSEAAPPYSIHDHKFRWFIVFLVAAAAMMSPLSANIYFPVIPAIASDLQTSTQAINLSVTVYMIFQGISPSFFGAVCDVLGRRPVYIINFLIYLGACAGLANTHSYGELLGFRILQACGSASVIAIGSGSIGDISPPSERGMFMAIFGLGGMMGPAIGPVAGGTLSQAFGWQSLFWFLFALGAVILVAIILFLPETLRSIVGNGSIPAKGMNLSLLSVWQKHRRARKNAGDETLSLAADEKPPRKTWRDVQPLAPLKMFREKDVLAILSFNSATYSLFYATTASTGTVFKQVYHLSESDLGLCYLANGIGCLAATLVNGPRMTMDYKLVERKEEAKRKELNTEATLTEVEKPKAKKDLNDLSEFPIEQARLRSLPYYFAALICSNIAYGWFVNFSVHLAAPLIMQFIVGLTVTSIFNMASTLMVDLYPGQGASATAANNLYRCLAGAGTTAFIDPLINRFGVGWAFTFLCFVNCLFLPLVWLEVKNGMRWRHERAERVQARKAHDEEKKRAKAAERDSHGVDKH